MKTVTSYYDLVREIDSFPIFLISSPRSGSTLLMDKLAKDFPGTYSIGEPNKNKYSMAEFQLFVESTKKRYIVKEHSSHVFNPIEGVELNYSVPITDFLLKTNDLFKIVVKRKDVAAQIASLYISKVRDQWTYQINKDHSDLLTSPIEINESLIHSTVNLMHKFYADYSAFDNVRCEIFYEDFHATGPETSLAKTPRPNNYSDLLNIVSKML